MKNGNTREKETDGETLRSFSKIRKVKGRVEKTKPGYLRVQRGPNQRLQVNTTILYLKNNILLVIWTAGPDIMTSCPRASV